MKVITLPIGALVIIILLSSCMNSSVKYPDPPAATSKKAAYQFQEGQQTFFLEMDSLYLVADYRCWADTSYGIPVFKRLPYWVHKNSDSSTETEYILHSGAGEQLRLNHEGCKILIDPVSFITLPFYRHTKKLRMENGQVYYETANDSLRVSLIKDDLELAGNPGSAIFISNYADEPAIKITLRKGRVRLAGRYMGISIDRLLTSPGRQLIINRSSGKIINAIVDTDDIPTYEKSDKLRLQDSDLHEIFRAIHRWHSLPVKIKNTIPDFSFEGALSYKASLKGIFQLLEANGPIKCAIENDTIVVWHKDLK